MSIHPEAAKTVANEAAKAVYPVTVAGATLFGIGLQDWVYVTAILYAVLQSLFLVWKWVRDWREGRLRRVPVHVPEDAS